MSRVAVPKWESGQIGNLKLNNLIKLCKLLDISFEYLINGGELKTYNSSIEKPRNESLNNELSIPTENMSV